MENNRSKKMGRGGVGPMVGPAVAGCFFGVSKKETWHIFGNFFSQLCHLNCSCNIWIAVVTLHLQFCHLSLWFLRRILQLCWWNSSCANEIAVMLLFLLLWIQRTKSGTAHKNQKKITAGTHTTPLYLKTWHITEVLCFLLPSNCYIRSQPSTS